MRRKKQHPYTSTVHGAAKTLFPSISTTLKVVGNKTNWDPGCQEKEREKGEREERDEECSSEYEWRAVERVKVLMNCLRGADFFSFLAFPGCKVQREPAVE